MLLDSIDHLPFKWNAVVFLNPNKSFIIHTIYITTTRLHKFYKFEV